MRVSTRLLGRRRAVLTTPMANTWWGELPWQDSSVDSWFRTSPLGAFTANGYRLDDMAGNGWE
jgi:formylglycine-generating enzyme